MIMAKERDWVVVGIDDSDAAHSAAQYALREAMVGGLKLRLVYAYPPPELTTPVSNQVLTRLGAEAQDVVNRVRSSLNVPRQMSVETVVQDKAPKRLFKRQFEDARLIVLGQHHRGWREGLTAGRLASYVASHAPCPTIVVPRRWDPAQESDRPVIVTVDGETPAAGPLRVAFDAATARQSRLIVLRLHPYESSANEIVRCRTELTAQLAIWQQAYPSTQVHPTVLAGEPDRFITEAARDAALVIVGRPHKRGIAIWTRSATKAVLDRATCPLMVVPTEVAPDLAVLPRV